MMWEYTIPWMEYSSPAYKNENGQWKFNPPVYEQRYMTVVSILDDERWKGQFKKLVDFGCAELSLLQLLRNVKGVEHILEVDVDEHLLEDKKYRAKPIVIDWVSPRDRPLRLEVLKGSITTPDECLRDTDFVIAVEILEHLYAEELVDVPQNVFGFIQPKMAVFTTPNIEANVLFDSLLPNGFRHADHKFEWNREEFQNWSLNICTRYSNYSVKFMGVGLLPEEYQHLGCVSQIAVFVRNDLIYDGDIKTSNIDIPANTDPKLAYKTIYAVDYPFQLDERTRQEKIRDELNYLIRTTKGSVDHKYCDPQDLICHIDLSYLVHSTAQFECTENEVREILLENGYNVEGDTVIVEKEDKYGNLTESEDEYYDCEANLDTEACFMPNDEDEENWD